jgi:hypothetical protein
MVWRGLSTAAVSVGTTMISHSARSRPDGSPQRHSTIGQCHEWSCPSIVPNNFETVIVLSVIETGELALHRTLRGSVMSRRNPYGCRMVAIHSLTATGLVK